MFLVTTADESTWNKDQPIVFLGEWCRRFLRRNVWQELDAVVLPYHWEDRRKYNLDYRRLESIYESRLAWLSSTLGSIHGVTDDARYWRIIIGPWLRFFIDALFDRFESVRTALESRLVSDSWVLSYHLDDLTAVDFSGFYGSYTEDAWNHLVFAECGHILGMRATVIQDKELVIRDQKVSATLSTKRKLATTSRRICERTLASGFNRFCFIASNLPLGRLAHLELALGQLPCPLSPVAKVLDTPTDHQIRERLSDCHEVSPFSRLLSKLLPFALPKVYLESYSAHRKSALDQFPKRPRLIFTSTAYQADDGFKVWAAEHCVRGTPLVIGQHGGNMGLAHHNQTEDHQVKIADSFCSWGWKRGGDVNVRPMPSLQLSGGKIAFDSSGDILVVLASLPRYFYCHYSIPVGAQFLRYIEDQIAFVNCLHEAVRRHTRFRLNTDDFGWDIAARLEQAGLGWLIDISQEPIIKRLSQCRLCVASYNATVILQTLSANYPTVAYWDPKMFDIRPESAEFIESLRQVGILHDSYESAANLIDEVHDDIQAWWNQPLLQSVRAAFCQVYARTSNDWPKSWSSHLKSITLSSCNE